MEPSMKPVVALALAVALVLPAARAEAQETVSVGSQPPHPFTEEFLADPANIAAGEVIWQEQCQHCHGAKAYPGKAPKLKPSGYKPEFVYRRITDGFRAMPPWIDVYTDEERMQIVSYVLSKGFSP
jgi:mono/diheme cytochrome c family protein